jgi:transposase
MREARSKGKRVVFVDDSFFTYKTLQQTAYMLKKQQLLVDERITRTDRIALVAAVSEENGLEAFVITKENCNSEVFCRLLPGILEHGADAVLLADNVSFHLSRFTKTKLAEVELELIRNVPYSPELNAIEKVYLHIKTVYRTLRLNEIFSGVPRDLTTVLELAVTKFMKFPYTGDMALGGSQSHA